MNIAIIPARQGSKSIINKNLQKIGNKSLIERTIFSATDAKIFDHIILSTDIPSIINDYEKSKTITLKVRPSELAGDTALMTDVVTNIICDYANVKSKTKIWLLQPTAPFREKLDYKNILSLFTEDMAKSVISITDVDSNHPKRMYTIKDNKLYPLELAGFANKQDLPKVYLRSGHYYVFYIEDFLKYKSFYIKPCRPYKINRERASNIDNYHDLIIAKTIYERGFK